MVTRIRFEAIPGVGGAQSAPQASKLAALRVRTAPAQLQSAHNEAVVKILSVGGRCNRGAKSMAMAGRKASTMKGGATVGEFEVLGGAAGEEEDEELKQFFGDSADGGDVPLDDSVFEEAFTSVRRVKKEPRARVRGVPIPRSTLVPDDWKAEQAYQERGKKERKLERREADVEWARKAAAQRREARPVVTWDRARGTQIRPDEDSAALNGGETALDEDSAVLNAGETALDGDSAALKLGEIALEGDSAVGGILLDGQSAAFQPRNTLDRDSSASQLEGTALDGDSATALTLGNDVLDGNSAVFQLGGNPLDGDAAALHFGGTLQDGDLAASQPDEDLRIEEVGGAEESDWGELESEDDEERKPAVSGRAKPKNVRAELEFSSFEDIAQSLKENDLESKRADNGDAENDSKAERRSTVTLTAEEKALLRVKTLDFARISSNSWSPLQTFAASGQVFLTAELLRRGGVDVDAVDGDGLTALQRAVQAGRKSMVRMLIKAGANCRVVDRAGASLVHYSARLGNEDLCKLLLKNGVDVNAADADGWSALHVAVQSGRLEMVKALVYRGADMTQKTNDGCTALDLALAFGGCFNFYDTIKFIKKRLVFDVESRPQTEAVDHSV